MKQNKQIQNLSSLNPLPKDAWDEAKRSGVSMDLKEELRNELTAFYSKLIHKNGLLVYYEAGFRGVTNDTGKIITPLSQRIKELTDDLKKGTDSIIDQLEDELKS